MTNSAPIRLQFAVLDEDDESFGHFSPPKDEAWIHALEEFDEVNDAHQSGHLESKAFVSDCKAILRKEPGFLDAYAHIGHVYLDQDNLATALRWYKKGLAVALPLIAEDFRGPIPWHDLDNRPFLRLHHGAILCALHRGNLRNAIELMEQHLVWNPNDNIGVRYLLGDAYLLSGRLDKAATAIEPYAAEYPPYEYSLALIHFLQDQFVEAATALRRGFLANPYIGELLTGRVHLGKHRFWHPTSMMDPETAYQYVDLGAGRLWTGLLSAAAFLDWLFNCSAVLQERADWTAAREALTYERDFHARGKLVDLESQLIAGITDDVSRTLIRKVTDRRGTPCWPWEIEP